MLDKKIFMVTPSSLKYRLQSYFTNAEAEGFGSAVSLSSDGNTAIIGAPDSDRWAVNGGDTYLWSRNGSIWGQQYRFSRNGSSNEQFGYSVALSEDATLAIVGAIGYVGNNIGGAGIFTTSNNVRTADFGATALGTLAGDNAGYSVAISSTGTTVAIGVPGDDKPSPGAITNLGSVKVLQQTSAGNPYNWSLQATLEPTGSAFTTSSYRQMGFSVAISSDGNTLVSGGPNSGQAGEAYVYTRTNSIWTLQTILRPSDITLTEADTFGWSVSISSDGNTIAIGAAGKDITTQWNSLFERNAADPTNEGAVYIYTRSGTTWTEEIKLISGDTTSYASSANFGYRVALSKNGTNLLVSAGWDYANSAKGYVYVYTKSGSSWTQFDRISAYAPGLITKQFGWSIATSYDASTILISSRDPYYCFVYTKI